MYNYQMCLNIVIQQTSLIELYSSYVKEDNQGKEKERETIDEISLFYLHFQFIRQCHLFNLQVEVAFLAPSPTPEKRKGNEFKLYALTM